MAARLIAATTRRPKLPSLDRWAAIYVVVLFLIVVLCTAPVLMALLIVANGGAR